MELQFIRHATIIIKCEGKRILVDPVLARVGDIDFVPYSENRRRNPLIELKTSLEELLTVDAVAVTHMHVDHFDMRARNRLRKNIPIFCQACNENEIRKAGFLDVRPIEAMTEFEGIKIHRVDGKHGEGEALSIMGKTSGYIFEDSKGFKTYIVGDSIWCNTVKDIIEKFKPDVIAVNAGAESLPVGRPTTMDEDDILKLINNVPDTTRIVAVHMDTWNHCKLKRDELEEVLQRKNLGQRVIIPEENHNIIL